jgi:acetate kinase
LNIVVANVGSTSFKFRLFRFDGTAEPVLLARGGYERVTDFGRAIDDSLDELRAAGHLRSPSDLHGVGFKTVLGKDLTGCVRADERVIAALDGFREIAPAHNAAYAEAIRIFHEKLPNVPLVALFETAFYQWVPEAASRYAVPDAWYRAGVRRYGFHGASHKYVAERSAELLGRADVAERVRHLYQAGPVPVGPGRPSLRVISCHMGGSSSVTGLRDGIAIGSSMGMSPQSGLPQNNRVGDLDSAAVPYALKVLGLSLSDVERQLTKESGLFGLSGVGNDVRDIQRAAATGNARAQMAIEVFVRSARQWIGSFHFELGGCDAIVFTGGIGENSPEIRGAICAGAEALGLQLDPVRNGGLLRTEGEISAAGSAVRIFVIPANEELIVANETMRCLAARN